MNSLRINRRRSNVPSVASMFALLFACTLLGAAICWSQTLQKGISVQMASTTNAAPMPDADNENAWVVTVTDTGSVYLGAKPITLDALREMVQTTPFIRGQRLYIKADARTPYAKVLEVLQATRTGGMVPQVLLTAQAESLASGSIVPPKGLEVDTPSSPTFDARRTILWVLESGHSSTSLRLDHEEISWDTLPGALKLLQNPEKLIVVKADGALPFAEVARAIDACRAAGAKVILGMPSAI